MTFPAVFDQYREVWSIDFEYIAVDGERPVPVCYCLLGLRSGRRIERWLYGLKKPAPPPPITDRDLLLAFNAEAELSCYLVLGWPMPVNVLDLYVEFLLLRNGTSNPAGHGTGLLHALDAFGLPGIAAAEKTEMRDRILAGGPYSRQDRRDILRYCWTDVDATAALLGPLARVLSRTPNWLACAVHARGRYMRGVAHMVHQGIPIDTQTHDRLIANWAALRATMRDEVHARFPVFGKTGIDPKLFARWLAERGIWWPTTPTGKPKTDTDTLQDQVKIHPELRDILDVQSMLGRLRAGGLEIGSDGHNRTALWPFRAKTGRNQPSTTRYIYGPAVWQRGLIKPKLGRALISIDFRAQEFLIAAALSGDANMLAAYERGDPYMGFAIQAGMAPEGATKATHKPVRDVAKAIVLGTAYGMGVEELARRAGVSVLRARELLERHRKVYSAFWAWAEHVRDQARLTGVIRTCFGWRMRVDEDTRPTTLLNWPMQATGAEMLRLVVAKLVEAGRNVIAPIHDAVLVECAAADAERVKHHACAIMVDACRLVLGEQYTIGVEAEVIHYPDRYRDEDRGGPMWDRVMAALDLIAPARSAT